MAKKTIKKLSPGIYRDAHSIRAVVSIAAGRKERRFPFDTPLAEIKRWRNETVTKLEKLHPQRRAGAIGRGTFTADVRLHLKTLTIASWKSRRSELKAWEKARVGRVGFGGLRRRRITADHVKVVIKTWVDAGVPAKTIQNRVRAFTAFWHERDGADSWTPVDGVPFPKPPKRRPIYVTVDTILSVEAALRKAGDLKTHARYMVLTSTGARPVHLKRAERHDVDLESRRWNIAGAKGGEAIELWLNDDMIAAWREFIAAEAWGDFDATDYAKQLRAAGWPEHIRPYNAKHALGMDLGDKGVDLETIRDWYGQTDTDTTRIYTGVVRAKLKAASEAINGRLGWGTSGEKLPVVVANITENDRNNRISKLLAELQALTSGGS